MKEKFGIVENLCALANALFCKVNVAQVLNNQIYFDNVSCLDAAKLLFETQERYNGCSELECQNIVDSISRYICDRDALRMRVSQYGKIHVFELLSDLVDNLLLMQNGEVLCRYTHILYWRELVQSMGEELPVTAMHTIKDMEYGKPARKQFTWDFVARQNNEPLNQLMKRGVSEHHLHLWASVPYFQVSWLNLMNDIASSPYIQNFEKIDNEDWDLRQEWRRQEGILLPETRDSYRKDSLTTMYQQAALIRVYLCARLKGMSLRLDPLRVYELRDFPDFGMNVELTGILSDRGSEPLTESLFDKLIEKCGLRDEAEQAKLKAEFQSFAAKKEREKDFAFVMSLLQNPQQLYMENSHIQSVISSFQNLDGEPCADYALSLFSSQQFAGQEAYQIFGGERWFLYSMLRDIYMTFPTLERKEQNLFYAYLLLQIQIRSRMVQVDNKVGFDHFQKIQRRKSYFLGDSRSKELIMYLAVREPLNRLPHLLELEARIVPSDTPEQLYKDILQLESTTSEDSVWDKLGLGDSAEAERLKERYYYVFHFTKAKDKTDISELDRYAFEYRHFQFRKELEKKGRAIQLFRERYPHLASRVRGIDACSQEIGCRPENFAFVFRMLTNHTCVMDDYGQRCQMPRLGKTYHVGEDFLDLADGLRAIDEAIHFLNLDCGDRLGHALALCIEPRSWYEIKNGQISLPKQDYLDNIAWLYLTIQRYQIPGLEETALFLKTQFEYYFRQVYLNNIDEADMEMFMETGEACYKDREFARNYKTHQCMFSMEDYCRSWMLRGDHPELYQSGYFWQDEFLPDECSRFKVNEVYPSDPSIRYIPECSFLNFCYHYNVAVRRTGAEYVTVTIDDDYVKGVEAAQRALQFDIANRGLSVESNPTSNVKISTFRSYSKHPITVLYNKGLVHTTEDLRECPQVSVSINTDDSGVFFTSLENEYAVMARALETLQDKNGQQLYYKWEIYDWLDGVRQMGNSQSFQTGGP